MDGPGQRKRYIITIDGPAGAGKTTVSKALAEHLSYTYVDTGALYRGVAVAALSAGIGRDDDKGLASLCSGITLQFINTGGTQQLLLNGSDITGKIRTPEVTMMASAISARSVVRTCLLDLQRKMGEAKGVVFEGRDMGTVVFPEAEVKFFMDASPKTRAKRRYLEIKDKTSQSLEDVEKDMEKRDKNDSTRALAPLKPARDAVIIDTTDLDINGVVDLMISHIQKRSDV